jgi:hypothetical protein
LPLGVRIRGTVSYRRKGPAIENPQVRMIYYYGGARATLIFYLGKSLKEEEGRLGFDFAELDAKKTPANQPLLVFVELASRRGRQVTVESNTLAQVVWPVER